MVRYGAIATLMRNGKQESAKWCDMVRNGAKKCDLVRSQCKRYFVDLSVFVYTYNLPKALLIDPQDYAMWKAAAQSDCVSSLMGKIIHLRAWKLLPS